MSQEAKSIVHWLKANIMQVLLVIGMVANLYLVSKFTTKEEMEKHLESEAVKTVESDKIHLQLATAVSKLEFISAISVQTSKQTELNTVKMADMDARLKNVEFNLQRITAR
jgi:hypothetical protein